jgi:hypothetical protein
VIHLAIPAPRAVEAERGKHQWPGTPNKTLVSKREGHAYWGRFQEVYQLPAEDNVRTDSFSGEGGGRRIEFR